VVRQAVDDVLEVGSGLDTGQLGALGERVEEVSARTWAKAYTRALGDVHGVQGTSCSEEAEPEAS
jgi:hypothetical protein